MVLPAVSTLLVLGALALAGESASDSATANAPAQAAPPAAAPQETKDVPATADPIEAARKFAADQKVDTSKSGWKQQLPKPPKFTFDPKKVYYWKIETNVGVVKIKLLPDVAPMHVSSTIYLATLGYYDGISFHRVIPGFMAQGGDPTGKGSGGPGYQYSGEFSDKVKHDKGGKLSMANAGPGTDGSQFFLTFAATAWLDGKHTIFGEVVEGADTTLKELEKRGTKGGAPTEALTMKKTTIEVADAK
jgi:cyclophilin family peptidyl-prolyl cis-trans isomerase